MSLKELRVERFRKDITQEQMAKLLNLSPTTYVRRENGTNEFSRKEIAEIARLLNLSLDRVNEIFLTMNLPNVQLNKRVLNKGGI